MKRVMKSKRPLTLMVAASVAAWLGGCGSSGGQGADTQVPLQAGHLIDAAVEGADFNGTLGSHGVTDSNGTFYFKKGEKLVFALGSYPLGEVDLASASNGVTITPVDLVKGRVIGKPSPADMNDTKVVAMLQVLQTADANQNPNDGITITEKEKKVISDAFAGDQNKDAEQVGSVLDHQVVSADDAKKHFEKSIEDSFGNASSQESGGETGMSSSSEMASEGGDTHGETSTTSEPSSSESNAQPNKENDIENKSENSSSSATGSNSDDHSNSDSSTEQEGGDTGTDGGDTGTGSAGSSSTSGGTGAYTLLAWNDLGMHCMDGKDFSVFSILPPYNTLNAQLIKKAGTSNKHVTSGVTITYSAAASLDGKYNTTSLYDSGNNLKTNFWEYVGALFNANPTPDTGLTGNHVPDLTEHTLSYNGTHDWWEATGLPLTPYNDDGSKNYYPMVKVTAKDASGNVLATTKVVLPISDEMDCKACHGSNSGYSAAKPSAGWENDANAERDFKWNILRLHDEKFKTAVSDHQAALKAAGYNGYNNAGLYPTAKSGNPVLCATCHASNALSGTGIAGIKPLTEAIHDLHAKAIDPTNGQTLGSSTNRSACYRCHPGATTKCLRGAMGKQSNIQCQSCHGSMAAVGAHGRNGWLDEPNCQACHQGGKRYTTAVTDMQTGTLRAALDTRFATTPNTPAPGVSLYRFSTGHGKMQCEACHGSTHAIYPSSHPEDNLQSIAVQGHEGTIAECTACHDTVPRTTSGGPHGMHSVGQYWVGAHGGIAEHNRTQCAACHGSDYRGSMLSKTSSSRSFGTEWGTKHFSAGHAVSCYDCHNGPNGGD